MRTAFALLALCAAAAAQDPRDIAFGREIPSEGYADQPYVVKTADGAWLCLMTTGKGVEGEGGQHVIALRSRDQGKTWPEKADIEPAGGPEASWVTPLVTPSGRIYAFYTYNRDNIREVPGAGGVSRRVDTLGAFVFKYSDDGGRTWSPRRYEIPMLTTPDDAENNFGGRTLFFWSVAKPVADRGTVYIGFAKVFRWGTPGTLVRSAGFLMRSDNLLRERDPERIRWSMLPEDLRGLRAPKGPIAEETNIAPLADGSLYAVYRTIDGYLCDAYSRDGGRSWTPPSYAAFGPGRRRIKNPRAFSFVRRLSNGKYLLWFHNHGGEPVHLRENWPYYMERNPGWIAGGIEREGRIAWSQPEILLYDQKPETRISYPDLFEDGGRYFITETQKSTARVHEIAGGLLEGLWSQFAPGRVAAGAALEIARPFPGSRQPMPALDAGAGFTLDFWFRLRELSPGQVILDTRDASGKGIAITTSERFSLRLTMHDGATQASWESDPGTHPGTLKTDAWQHAAVIVDGGPKIVMWVIDGALNDGGATRQFGWGRYPAALGALGGGEIAAAPKVLGEIRNLRIYPRALRVSEAVGNYSSGLK